MKRVPWRREAAAWFGHVVKITALGLEVYRWPKSFDSHSTFFEIQEGR
jgi:hypothetical protein